jgi:hypothetical protein
MPEEQGSIEKISGRFGKWLLGMISTITAAISFVNLIRGNYQLGLVIFIVLIVVNLLLFLLFVIFNSKPASPKSKKKIYSYERYRKPAIAGLVILLVAIVAVFSNSENRRFASVALMGTPTATPTPTPTLGPPNVTMVVSVQEGYQCGIYLGEDFLSTPQKSTVDIGINNNSDRDVIVDSALLVPEWVFAGQWLGPIPVTETYSVSVDEWWGQWRYFEGFAYEIEGYPTPTADELMRFKKEGSVIWVRPDPIAADDVVHDKYTIKKNSQERFQITLGLSEKYQWLIGTLFLEIGLDNGMTLRSDLLDFVVCYEEGHK